MTEASQTARVLPAYHCTHELFTRNAYSICRLAAGATVLCCLGLPALLALPAQTKDRRVVSKVVDKSDTGIKGATVYLKDGHTLEVKSYIAADDGSYRFGQLAQNTDYELSAQADGKKSSVKNLSSFDTRATFNITLKIDIGK